MREIKFRGYNKEKGWVYGNLLEDVRLQEGSIYQIVNKTTDSRFDVEEDSIGQYTGFKDKNGAKIYEGDIVKVDDDEDYTIEFDANNGWIGIHEDDMEEIVHNLSIICNEFYAEVVSNIYEEKLKGEKWIVHRTLRTENTETYIGIDDSNIRTFSNFAVTYNKDKAEKVSFEQAVRRRDVLNKDRIGKQYLWVISKVEE